MREAESCGRIQKARLAFADERADACAYTRHDRAESRFAVLCREEKSQLARWKIVVVVPRKVLVRLGHSELRARATRRLEAACCLGLRLFANLNFIWQNLRSINAMRNAKCNVFLNFKVRSVETDCPEATEALVIQRPIR